MRAALWLLALFCMAVAIALFAGNNQGSVTLFWPPYRIDLSFNLTLLTLFALFLLLHLALRALAGLLALPAQARRWRARRQERVLHAGLLDALSHLVAGRFIRSRKAALQLLEQEQTLQHMEEGLAPLPRLRALSHLLAAESAHALQDRPMRDEQLRLALTHTAGRDDAELREGLQLRAARWAFDDRDVQTAQLRLEELPHGAARRTLALRLRFKVARLAGQTRMALEMARLLAKHRAFSETAAVSIVRGLAIEWLRSAHDPQQLLKVWSELDEREQRLPEVAVEAAERLLALQGDVALAFEWLLPIWERLTQPQPGAELGSEQRIGLVLALERGMAAAAGVPDPAWLARIEAAQMRQPGDAVLQYLAGVACMHLSLWGKAEALLGKCQPQLPPGRLRRNAWVARARLAEQRGDTAAAAQAWRSAALE